MVVSERRLLDEEQGSCVIVGELRKTTILHWTAVLSESGNVWISLQIFTDSVIKNV